VSERQYGVSLNTSFGTHRVLSFICFVFAASLIGLAFFPFTRKVELYGLVLPSSGILDVATSSAGVISIKVKEGQTVKAGDLLFVVHNKLTGILGDDVGIEAVKSLKLKRESYNREMESIATHRIEDAQQLKMRVDEFQRQKSFVENEIQFRQKSIVISTTLMGRYRYLAEQHAVPQAQVEQKESDLLVERAGVAELQGAESALANAIVSAQSDYKESAFQLSQRQEELAREIAQSDRDIQQSTAERDSAVRAAHDGIISGITATDGERVVANERLATILSNRPMLQVQLFARSDSVGFLRVGTPVALRYRGFPFERFGQFSGKILNIDRVALTRDQLPPRAEVLLTSAGVIEPIYRVQVAVDQSNSDGDRLRTLNITPGMAVDAVASVETKKIYAWAFDPIRSIADRVGRN